MVQLTSKSTPKKKSRKKYILLAILIIFIAGIVMLIYEGSQEKAAEIQTLEDAMTCDGSPSGKLTHWAPFTSKIGKYTVMFPGDVPDNDIDDHLQTSEQAGDVRGSAISEVWNGDFMVKYIGWDKETTLNDIAKSEGAVKFCSKPGDTYDGHPMIDFLVLEYYTNYIDGIYYKRERVILNKTASYTLMLTPSTPPHFNDFDQFANSFHLK